jgi:hypothetical protein
VFIVSTSYFLGNIIATGTHAELIQTSEKYVKMVTAAEKEEEKVESQIVLDVCYSNFQICISHSFSCYQR